MQPTDPHARVKEGPLPGLWGPHSSSFSRVKAHYDMELVMGSASSFTKEVERNKALLIKDAPPATGPPEYLWEHVRCADGVPAPGALQAGCGAERRHLHGEPLALECMQLPGCNS